MAIETYTERHPVPFWSKRVWTLEEDGVRIDDKWIGGAARTKVLFSQLYPFPDEVRRRSDHFHSAWPVIAISSLFIFYFYYGQPDESRYFLATIPWYVHAFAVAFGVVILLACWVLLLTWRRVEFRVFKRRDGNVMFTVTSMSAERKRFPAFVQAITDRVRASRGIDETEVRTAPSPQAHG